MTAYEKLIEAMARGRCLRELKAKSRTLENHGAEVERIWKRYIPEITAELADIRAALPGLGLRVVPVEATLPMLHAGSIGAQCFGTALTRTEGAYKAMLAACPDPLAPEAKDDAS